MSKPERQATVDALAEQLRASPNLYVTDFSGLNVLRMTEFRRRLRAAGVTFNFIRSPLRSSSTSYSCPAFSSPSAYV